MKNKSAILFAAMLLCHALPGAAQDTSKRSVTLPEVSVIELNSRPDDKFVQTPTQVVSVREMEQLGGTRLDDAVRQMSGVSLKDYGGLGGVKTVSVRGLGSQFSTLTIDGIAVNDCQNGQVDLGRYLLGNSSYIPLANGQGDQSLQAARALAAGSVVNMETHEPEFGARPFRLSAGAEAGSFGYLSPTLAYEQRLGRKASLSLWGNYARSDGDYPFTIRYAQTGREGDSTSREIRENSQVRTGTADANLFYRFDSHRRLHVKAHYMQGFHALPGPVIWYRVKESDSHSEERLAFAQARYRKTGQRLDVQALAKYRRSDDAYEDSLGHGYPVRNEYMQREAYLSQTVRYHLDGDMQPEYFSLSLAADESASRMTSNLSRHSDVQRLAALAALTADYTAHLLSLFDGLKASAHLLGTWVRDYEPERCGDPHARLSPYAGLTYTRGDITLRYFFKETFRVPNFNELYYFTTEHALRPEKAAQHNLGLTYHGKTAHLGDRLRTRLGGTADAYRNHVSDKIIAVPTQNMYLWSMKNMGIVEITGADLTATASLYRADSNGTHPWQVDLSLGYSWQQAVDRTDPESKSYGHQIPYTPRHSGNAALIVQSPWVDLGYTLTLVGDRYYLEQNSAASRVPGYADHGITLSHDFPLGRRHTAPHTADTRSRLKVKAQVLNLLDKQYEVVRSYPMMGRNYRLALIIEI